MGAVDGGEAVHVWGQGVEGKLCTRPQSCCEPKTVLTNKILIKKNKKERKERKNEMDERKKACPIKYQDVISIVIRPCDSNVLINTQKC